MKKVMYPVFIVVTIFIIYWFASAGTRRENRLVELVTENNVRTLEKELSDGTARWLKTRILEYPDNAKVATPGIRMLGKLDNNAGVGSIEDIYHLLSGGQEYERERMVCIEALVLNGSEDAYKIVTDIWTHASAAERVEIAKALQNTTKSSGNVTTSQEAEKLLKKTINNQVWQANQLQELARWDEAAELWEQVLALNPTHPAALASLKICKGSKGLELEIERQLTRKGNALVLSGRIHNPFEFAVNQITVRASWLYLGPGENTARAVDFTIEGVLRPGATRAFSIAKPMPGIPEGKFDVKMMFIHLLTFKIVKP